MSTAVSENKQFKKYNHALIPSVPPHLLEIPSKQDIRHLVWKSKVLFARYTSDFQLITPPITISEVLLSSRIQCLRIPSRKCGISAFVRCQFLWNH